MQKLKLRVDSYDHDDYKFTCDCMIGKDTAGTYEVTEDELASWLGAVSLDMIPVVVFPGEDNERETWASLEQWQESNDTAQVLAEYLNHIESRTEQAPFKCNPLPASEMFLAPKQSPFHFIQ